LLLLLLQGGSNLVNLGGVLDYYYSSFPPAPPCPVPPPANLRGGTGVFIPRTACAFPPAKGNPRRRIPISCPVWLRANVSVLAPSNKHGIDQNEQKKEKRNLKKTHPLFIANA
jgi:hypothetical protein